MFRLSALLHLFSPIHFFKAERLQLESQYVFFLIINTWYSTCYLLFITVIVRRSYCKSISNFTLFILFSGLIEILIINWLTFPIVINTWCSTWYLVFIIVIVKWSYCRSIPNSKLFDIFFLKSDWDPNFESFYISFM